MNGLSKFVESTYRANRDKLSVWLSGTVVRGVMWVAAAVMSEQAVAAETPATQIGNGAAALVLALIPFGWEWVRSKVIVKEAKTLEKSRDEARARSDRDYDNLADVVTAIENAKAADGAVYFKDAKTLRKLNKMGEDAKAAVDEIQRDYKETN